MAENPTGLSLVVFAYWSSGLETQSNHQTSEAKQDQVPQLVGLVEYRGEETAHLGLLYVTRWDD
jgi:hypothetical protein